MNEQGFLQKLAGLMESSRFFNNLRYGIVKMSFVQALFCRSYQISHLSNHGYKCSKHGCVRVRAKHVVSEANV